MGYFTSPKTVKPKATWKMFDQIASSYDRLNRILSFNIDSKWRKRVADFVPTRPFNLVDLATGTGDLLLTLLKNCPQITKATGVDMSQEMLRIGERKMLQNGFYEKTDMRVGDAEKLLLTDKSFDMATIAFGIRNTSNPLKTLQEIYRILKPDGIVVVLEFSLPGNFLIRNVFLAYFRFLLPLIGGLISKNYRAYRYLNQSVEQFPYGKDFLRMMRSAQFTGLDEYPLTFGIATLYLGRK